jgi:hypothetical protein
MYIIGIFPKGPPWSFMYMHMYMYIIITFQKGLYTSLYFPMEFQSI